MRGYGLGLQLASACVKIAKRDGVPAVGIHSADFMEAACRVYEQFGFRRCPVFDLPASKWLGVDGEAGELAVIAYRLDLAVADAVLLPCTANGASVGLNGQKGY